MKPFRRPVLYGIGLATLWTVLAWNDPSTTYHLAPLLIAAVVPLGIALEGDHGRRSLVVGAAAGLTMTATVVGVLAATDHLAGPSLLPTGGAVLEAAVFAPVGAFAGVAIGAFTRG